jgi:hypothetical protein
MLTWMRAQNLLLEAGLPLGLILWYLTGSWGMFWVVPIPLLASHGTLYVINTVLSDFVEGYYEAFNKAWDQVYEEE